MIRASQLLLAITAGLCACQRAPEIELLASVRSPNGMLDAVVEEHVYGPHFGGETPAVEVHIRSAGQSRSASGLVFQAPSEQGTVSVQWRTSQQLEISITSPHAPPVYRPEYNGTQVTLIRK